MSELLRVGSVISGGGTTMEALGKACGEGSLQGMAELAVVLSTRADAKGIDKARALEVPTIVIDKRDYKGRPDEFADEVLQSLAPFGVALLSFNGLLDLMPGRVVESFPNVINQHPGPLDPPSPRDFGGKGMYGLRVHAARVAYEWVTGVEEPWTESTVHYVTNREVFDDGAVIRSVDMTIPHIFSRPVTIGLLESSGKLQEELRQAAIETAAALLPLEHQNVIEVVRSFAAEGTVYPQPTRPHPLVPESQEDLLSRVKALGVQLFPKG